MTIKLTQSADMAWSLCRGVVSRADEMDDHALQQATVSLYSQLLDAMSTASARHPVRAWNLVPQIHRSQGEGLDRYMAFNAGRHEAYVAWFGCDKTMAGTMPTASAVGYAGQDLVVHLLGHRQAGQAIENPRQIPAFRYSARYGKVPPSFVRATVLPHNGSSVQQVFVAGTASVVGEDSHHPEDLTRQLDETFRNLAAVLLTAKRQQETMNGSITREGRDALNLYRSARVYVRHPQDLEAIRSAVKQYMPMISDEDCEFVHADICRPELLVEIEGVAELPVNTKAS